MCTLTKLFRNKTTHASTDYRNDVRISQTIMKSLSETYRRIRNTAHFLLGNLHGFDPRKDALLYEELLSMDRWILDRLHRVIGKAREAFEEYEFHVPTNAIHSLCVNELSAFYLDVSKDRLYMEGADSLGLSSSNTWANSVSSMGVPSSDTCTSNPLPYVMMARAAHLPI